MTNNVSHLDNPKLCIGGHRLQAIITSKEIPHLRTFTMISHSLSVFGFILLGLILATVLGIALLSTFCKSNNQNILYDVEGSPLCKSHEYYRHRAGSVSSMIHVSPSHPIIFGQGQGFRGSRPVPVVQMIVTPPTPAKANRGSSIASESG
ncbi:hypothetical protein BD779DRAFT_1205715 [Infundibulicybe gibba]|nr:hypothetical protein BD779DRAFT_1205715 [Infundibulicybe gibba]